MKLQNNFSLPQNLEYLFNLNFLDFKDFFIKTLVLKPRIIGILNITKDSFSDGGKFYDIDRAIEQMLNLHNDGASIIEIGAQSTRPNSLMHSIENEYSKLNEFFTKAKNIIIEKKFKLV
jgi:dihydropteroate synthase